MTSNELSSKQHEKVTCLHCGVVNPVSHVYCSNCGERIAPEIKVSEDMVIPEKELREFVLQVCDQHFENGEVIRKRLTTEITQQASNSLGGWLRLVDTTIRNFLLVVAIVTGVAAFLGYKTYQDIQRTVTAKITKHFESLDREAEERRREFRIHIQKAQALRDHLQKIIQVTRFIQTSTNENHLTAKTKSFLDQVIKGYREYLLGLGVVPASPIINIDVNTKYAGFPHFDQALNTLRLDPHSSLDKDLVCRFYTSSLLAKYSELRKLLSGLAYYFPCSWQNDPRFAEIYAGTPGAKRERRLEERNLKTTRRVQDLPDNPSVEEAGEIWGATFWDIREKLGTEDTDRIIAGTVLDFVPDSSGPDEERRFVNKLIQKAHAVQGGKRVSEIRSIFKDRGWRF